MKISFVQAYLASSYFTLFMGFGVCFVSTGIIVLIKKPHCYYQYKKELIEEYLQKAYTDIDNLNFLNAYKHYSQARQEFKDVSFWTNNDFENYLETTNWFYFEQIDSLVNKLTLPIHGIMNEQSSYFYSYNPEKLESIQIENNLDNLVKSIDSNAISLDGNLVKKIYLYHLWKGEEAPAEFSDTTATDFEQESFASQPLIKLDIIQHLNNPSLKKIIFMYHYGLAKTFIAKSLEPKTFFFKTMANFKMQQKYNDMAINKLSKLLEITPYIENFNANDSMYLIQKIAFLYAQKGNKEKAGSFYDSVEKKKNSLNNKEEKKYPLEGFQRTHFFDDLFITESREHSLFETAALVDKIAEKHQDKLMRFSIEQLNAINAYEEGLEDNKMIFRVIVGIATLILFYAYPSYQTHNELSQQSEDLEFNNKQLTSAQHELVEKNKQLLKQSYDLEQKNKQLEEAQAELAQKNEALETGNQDLQKAKDELSTKNKSLEKEQRLTLFLYKELTEKNEVSETNNQELQEKNKQMEGLQQEQNHRIKNDMWSLRCRIQDKANHSDPTTRKILEESCLNVDAVLLVYKLLFDKRQFKTLNLKEYLHILLGNLQRNHLTFSSYSQTIDVTLTEVAFETIRELGLVLTELIINASKHAPNKPLTIEIANNPETLQITVQDGGNGFPPQVIEGFGLPFVKGIIEKMDGDIQWLQNDLGLKVLIQIPLSNL